MSSQIQCVDYNLGEGVIAFSTLRGDSVEAENPYSGFSVCHYCGQPEQQTQQCREELCNTLGIDSRHLFVPTQTHSIDVAVITPAEIYAPERETIQADALVTALPEVALCVNTADCVPIAMADTAAGVIAAVHSGWRGTIGQIAALAVEKMVELGADPERIRAAMGPSICSECFEVGGEVACQFIDGFGLSTIKSIDYTTGKAHVDLPRAIEQSLLDCGLKAENIVYPPVCSKCNSGLVFSARALGVNSGRTATIIMIKR